MAKNTWSRIEWNNGDNMAGPTDAIKAVAAWLDEQGKEYKVTVIKGPKTVRTTRKKVADLDLEVRSDPSTEGADM